MNVVERRGPWVLAGCGGWREAGCWDTHPLKALGDVKQRISGGGGAQAVSLYL